MSTTKPRLLYALVTQLDQPECTILSQYPNLENRPELQQVAHKLIKQSYNGQDLMRTASSAEINFHLQIQHDLAVIVACTKNMKSRIAFKAIDGIFLRYLREGRPQKRRQIKSILKDELAKGNTLENDKIYQAEKNIEEVKAITLDNIDKVLQRGEDLDTLDDRATLLKNDALVFKRKSNKLKKKTLMSLILLMVLFVILLLFVLLLIVGALFGLICVAIPMWWWPKNLGFCFTGTDEK